MAERNKGRGVRRRKIPNFQDKKERGVKWAAGGGGRDKKEARGGKCEKGRKTGRRGSTTGNGTREFEEGYITSGS